MRKGYRHIGVLIGLLGLGLVVRELVRGWDEVAGGFQRLNAWDLIGAFTLGFLAMAVMGLGWGKVLKALGSSRPLLGTLYRFSMGEMGKYLPGGVWSVVGRGEMARRVGVPGSIAYQGTFLSIALTYLAACLVAATAWLIDGSTPGSRWSLLLGILPLGLLALHPTAQTLAYRGLGKLTKGKAEFRVLSWLSSVRLMLWHVPAWLGVAGATWLLASALETNSVDPWNILFATCIAWTAGLLAVPVPGGLGVREAVFLSVVTTLSTTGIAAAVAIASRILFVLVDTVSVVVFSLLNHRNRGR